MEVAMDRAMRLAVLRQWFELYTDFMATVEVACARQCAACCTCNVTCTTLEAELIYDHLTVNGGLERLAPRIAGVSSHRFQPAVTTNEMVALCLKGGALPEETNDPGAGICPWLESDACTIYPVRPFGCRAMCSTEECTAHGEAVMPPLVLSVNNVMLQYVEALDRPGGTGNLADVLSFLSSEQKPGTGADRVVSPISPPLLANRPFPALMIPPEHRQAMAPLLKAIGQVVRQGS